MSSETTTPVTCALCLAVIPANEAEDLYCYGCGEHICERCDETGGGMGHHDAALALAFMNAKRRK